MIAKTSSIKKWVFYPLTAASLAMTCMLFWSFGASTFGSMLLVVVSIGLETLKILSLINWSNARLLNRKAIKWVPPFIIYCVIAIVSAFASLAYGLAEVETLSARASGKSSEIQTLRSKIEVTENQIKEMASSVVENSQRDTIKKQIAALQSQMGKIEYNIAERSIELNREIERLNKQLTATTSDERKNLAIERLGDLRRQYGALQSASTDGISGLDAVAEAIGCMPQKVRLVFLWVWTILLEVGMAMTATGAVTFAKEKAAKKKRNREQMTFGDMK